MATPAVNGTTQTYPDTKFAHDLGKQAQRAHGRTLSRLANLSVSTNAASIQPATLNATIDEFHSHGVTATVFSDIFLLFQKGQLSREELDQRLINWGLTIPGLKEKFDELPDVVKKCVDEFVKVDLKSGKTAYGVPSASEFKLPTNLKTARKCAALKAAWEDKVKKGEGKEYPSIVENTGEPVPYVDKFAFENWGETSRGTPAVNLHHMI
jgi:hypothetical protein